MNRYRIFKFLGNLLVYALLLEPWEELRTPEEIAESLEEELAVGQCAPASKPRSPRRKPPAAPEAAAEAPPSRAD